MSASAGHIIETIDVTSLEQLRRDGAVTRILDVRTGGEFESAHIPGSYNVPLDTLVKHVGDFAALEGPIVLVCQSGVRAGQARAKLASAGKTALHTLDGGLNAWIAASGEVNRGKDRWALDRQVRLMAGTVALTALLASVVVPRAKWIAGGVAAGLIYMAVTEKCPVTPVMESLPYNRTSPCDVGRVLADLNG